MQDISKQTIAQINGRFEQQLAQINLPQQYEDLGNKYLDKINDLVFDTLNWEKMKSKYAELYESVLTKDEINQLLAFYKSDIGQVALKKMPILMEKSMLLGQKEMAKISDQMRTLQKEFVDEVEARKEGRQINKNP